MKNTILTVTFTPIAVSIICGILLAVNNVIPVVQAWPLWALFFISTAITFFVVGSMVLTGVAQWIVQQVNKQAA